MANANFVVMDDDTSDFSDTDLSFTGVVDGKLVDDIDSDATDDDVSSDFGDDSDSEPEYHSHHTPKIFCWLCKRSYSKDSFSAQRQKMARTETDRTKIFCLNHTSTSSFGDAYTKSQTRSTPLLVDMISHRGKVLGSRNRNILTRKGVMVSVR